MTESTKNALQNNLSEAIRLQGTKFEPRLRTVIRSRTNTVPLRPTSLKLVTAQRTDVGSTN